MPEARQTAIEEVPSRCRSVDRRRRWRSSRSAAVAEPILVPRGSKVPAQDSEFLTTSTGVRLHHTDDSLKVGSRGPTLMDDFHLREKITHFDHERIPERVVHARGVGVHGIFESYGTASKLHRRRVPPAGRRDAGVHPLLDGASARGARPTRCATCGASR